MKERVLRELDRIQHEYEVQVLLAVESGSRAWGFASPDSDYDVRFVYAHRADWYLSVFERRDVIEEMLPDALDVSGWDLRKTLRLFSKCNLALNEWLGSPIVYAQVPEFKNQLQQLIPEHFNPIAATHHYRSMAEGALKDGFATGQIRIKKLFYVLRPLLACRWIEHARSQPPTELERLVAPEWVSAEEKERIADLLRRKAAAAEGELLQLDQSLAGAIHTELERYKLASQFLPALPTKDATRLDSLLRRFVWR